MTIPQPPMTILEAIARMEGFYVTGSRPNRNHNPGDLEFGQFSSTHGAISGDPRFAIFPDEQTGFAALKALLQTPGYRGLTVEKCINRYAPPVENETSGYVHWVCAWVGCQPTDIIDPLVEAS